MMPYIHFTDEQKRRAASIDLKVFLERRGEKFIRSGPEYRMASDHSITIRGNEWYDHASGDGGGPISFVQNRYNLSYPEAVTCLLDGEKGEVVQSVAKEKKTQKPFTLPRQGQTMRRLYAYLLQKRFINHDILNSFVRAGLIYESCEHSRDGKSEYHNAVFVGNDEHGVARHAHQRSVNDMGKTFRINVEGSNPKCSFHWNGQSDRLYVFEAPIDLLSFVSLYPKGWVSHSYVSLCGTSEHALLWMLEQNPSLHNVFLCLDHDEAGIEACGRLADILHQKGDWRITQLQSIHKDWNEDLKASCGMTGQPAEDHPQSIVAAPICQRIGAASISVNLDRIDLALPQLLSQYKNNLQWGRPEKAMECMEQMSALALAAYGRELRQLGAPTVPDEVEMLLNRQIKPHQNRANLKHRHSEIALEMQSVLERASAVGLRSPEDKQQLAAAWMALAASCAKVPIKYEADKLKEQKHEREMAQEQKEMEGSVWMQAHGF